MNVLVWVGVAALGGFGALLRFFVDGIVAGRSARDFPLGTFVVNVTGALVLGLLVGLAFGGDRLTLVGTATLGSYTTFSTWMLETHRLVEEGELPNATANVLVSLAVGLGAAALGRVIGAHL
ncbi:MAG TPA: fluoride efflux transporter CrcB [Solirubrobacteraceae bacterium]|nr:fluoride efflux transporter CrcB [Solirubrobacteraceae bacterium]